MSSEIKTLAKAFMVREFVQAIIGTINPDRFGMDNIEVINADLVPRTRQDKSLSPSIMKPIQYVVPAIPRAAPTSMRSFPMPPAQQFQMQRPQNNFRPPMGFNEPMNDYGKIMPLITDPTVSSIECQGPNKPLVIIRTGQKQFTKISMTKEEIEVFLKKVAENANVVLLDGVFRAAVDNFFINAIHSEIVGSKFSIRKQTPYSMLE